MNKLLVAARYQIHEGQLAEFKKLAEECVSIVKSKDKDTLEYDWYFDKAETEAVLREAYPDSNALIAHISNVGEAFGKLVTLGDFSAEIYGQPSEELMNLISGLKVTVYTHYLGS